jgi:hypothetical protein
LFGGANALITTFSKRKKNQFQNQNPKEKEMTEQDISPFKALDFIRDNAPAYAQAKANVVYMTEFRKTIKASLMASCSERTESAKETFAYSHPDYKAHLMALQQAVAEAERLRWLMVAAEAKIEVWRSLESSARAEGRSTT